MVDQEGYICVTGYSFRSSYDYVTIKYKSNGDSLWMRAYDNGSVDYGYAIAVDGSGNVYVTGGSRRSGYSDDDYATIKYDADGNEKWVKRYNYANGADYGYAIAVDGSGNVYVTGASFNGNNMDYATIKYNANGDSAWAQRYNYANGEDFARAIAVDQSGNVYVTGCSYSFSTYWDYATIKYDENGDQKWVRRYNYANGGDSAVAITVDASGNVYVTGASWSGSNMDYATIKYGPNGETLWVKRYNGAANGDDYAKAIAVDPYGNVYVTGFSYGGSGTGYDYATVKYNNNGDSMWAIRYDYANGADYAYGIAVDNMGRNVYVTGASWGGTDYKMDYATLQYYSIGNQVTLRQELRYNKDTNDYAYALAYSSGYIYVTGASDSSGQQDYLTNQYSMQVGGEEEKPGVI